MRVELEASMAANLQPLTDLREKLSAALQGLSQKASSNNDPALLVAVGEARSALENGNPLPTTSYPELENLRTIFEQQTVLRSKTVQSNMVGTLKKWKTNLITIKSKLKKDEERAVNFYLRNLEEYIEQDLNRLGSGEPLWAPGDTWRDLLKDGHYLGGSLPQKTGTGLILTSSTIDPTPRLTSDDRNKLPLELELIVVPGESTFFIELGGSKMIFNDSENPGHLKVVFRKALDWDSKLVPCKPITKGEPQKLDLKFHAEGYSVTLNGDAFCTSAEPYPSTVGPVAIGASNDSKIEILAAKFRTPGQARYTPLLTNSEESYRQLAAVTTPTKRIPIRSIAGIATPIPSTAKTKRPVADTRWPTSLALYDAPEVEEALEDSEKHVFIYKSPNYQFVCDSKLTVNVVREFGRIFEAAYLVNCKLPLDIQPEPEIFKPAFTARIITTDESYYRQGGVVGSAGVYIPSAKSILVPLSSLGVKLEKDKVYIDYANRDYHTLIHEITHQMMNRWLDKLPIWLIEGSAEFVAWATYNKGKFTFTDMEKNIPEKLGRRNLNVAGVTLPTLSTLMTYDHATWGASVQAGSASANYAGAALLTYYFYLLDDKKDGAHIVACFQAIRGGMPHAEAIKTHLLRGRTYEQLQLDMATAFEAEGVFMSFKDATPK